MSEAGSETVSESEQSETQGIAETPEQKKKNIIKPILGILIAVGLIFAARQLGLGNLLKNVEPWIKSLGPWGPIAFVGLYIASTVAMLPGSVLTVAAGVLFGSFWGVVWVSLGSTIGASICFLISRYILRDAVENWLGENKLFQKLDKLTRTQGGLIVAITRLVPVFPFNLLNYGFGLTNVRFITYVLASWICMLPGTALYVVGSDAFKKAIQSGEIPWPLVGGVVVLIVVLSLIGRVANKKLKESEEEISGA